MKVAVVGNGVAGVTTARLLAERDASAEITIFSDERYLYYYRPRLVEVAGNRVTPDEICAYSADWYAERRIGVVLGTAVTDIDPAEHRLTLSDGSSAGYDRLVLATGASAWVPPILGADMPGVRTLRTMTDALALRDAAEAGTRVLVLGGGLLGLEVAAALSGRGVRVSVVEVSDRLLPRQLDREGAAVLQERIERNGVEIITGDSCMVIQGEGHAQRCVLKSGQVVGFDCIVVSAGARSNTSLAQRAGIACGRGAVVNDRLQTSAPDVFAVGDVAEYEGRIWGIVPAALAQARVVAAQLAGDESVLYKDIVPSTTLKVTGIDVTSIGEAIPEAPGATMVCSVRSAEGAYSKLVIRKGRVVGAIMVGSRAKLRAVNLLMSNGTDVSAHVPSLLSDGFDLIGLARQRVPA
ncbi:MAG TPA: FAD-dependent oxidoreductase [Anaerolineae bacterium]|nr:FAD-dependent oxidoreductase [Anaerolineae bacterium]